MAERTEWMRASSSGANIEPPGSYHDAHGTKNDDYVLLTGTDSVIAVEGSLDELDAMADRIKALVQKERDNAPWVDFDVRVELSVAPELAERVRKHLFDELLAIEGNVDEVLALEHDLAGLWARTLDRGLNPFYTIGHLDDSDTDQNYRWFGGKAT